MAQQRKGLIPQIDPQEPTAERYQRDLNRRSRPEYARFRMDLIQRILAEHLTPLQVAQHLEASANAFPEITLEECRRYRQMGTTWTPL